MNVNCEVPRVKGNVSKDDLQLYHGHSALYKATRTDNEDGTLKLSVSVNLYLTQAMNNSNITCKYSSTNGDVQLAHYVIILGELYSLIFRRC